MKPMLPINGEQLNKGPSNEYRSWFDKVKWPCNKIVY